jgi:hypothetical protein
MMDTTVVKNVVSQSKPGSGHDTKEPPRAIPYVFGSRNYSRSRENTDDKKDLDAKCMDGISHDRRRLVRPIAHTCAHVYTTCRGSKPDKLKLLFLVNYLALR